MSGTLADHLRALPDQRMATAIRLRPDLVVPVPADISALAVRAQSRLSVARALDGLDRFSLQILDAVRLSRGGDPAISSVDDVLALTAPGGVEPARVRATLEHLRDLLLVYGGDGSLHVVAGVDEVCSPYPAGLGRPAVELSGEAAALVADAARLRRTVLAAPPAARAVLDRLAEGPPVGTVTSGALTDPTADPESPVRWLVTRQLLVPVGESAVELPREVALLLRRDSGPLGPLHPQPPVADGTVRDPATTDRAGAGQAMEAVRQVEALLEALSAEPAPLLRTGGLGIRELRRLAKLARLDEPAAATLIEVAYAAGLLGDGGGLGAGIGTSVGAGSNDSGEPLLLPAAGYDQWRVAPLAERWVRLALAWLLMTRAPALIGDRDERDRLISALSPEAERIGAPTARRAALEVLAEAAPGCAVGADAVAEALAWRAPRRASRAASTGASGPAEVLADAATLGVTGLGALTGFGRVLLADLEASVKADDDPLGVLEGEPGRESASELLDALLPAPVDTMMLQADLSAVVPGPPTPALAAELSLVAEAESPSVYRVTPDSIRRALDAGYAATDLHSLFTRRSRTPVPQALTYMIDDVARRHGGLRVGTATAYLRSDDEALVSQVLADRRLVQVNLRRLAPTVLASSYPTARLLAALREAGYAPVPEDASGAAVLTRPKTRRAPARSPVPGRGPEDPLATPRLAAPRLAGIVEQIRRGEAVADAARKRPVAVRTADPQAHAQALAVLQQAVRDKTRVWVGYVDAHGAAASRLVRPVSVAAGYLRAEDERTETLHTFALHRITAAVFEEP